MFGITEIVVNAHATAERALNTPENIYNEPGWHNTNDPFATEESKATMMEKLQSEGYVEICMRGGGTSDYWSASV